MPLPSISPSDFGRLRHGAQVIEADRYGDKVLRLTDGSVLKLFRRKSLLSSQLFSSYAERFAANAAGLERLGISAVTVTQTGRCRELARDFVRYGWLEGTPLQHVLASCSTEERLIQLSAFARYLALLHSKGILFRSLHFGNVLVRTDGSFALIDISDMILHSAPLSTLQRVRNFRAFLRRRQDRELITSIGAAHFLDLYLQASSTPRSLFMFLLHFMPSHPLRPLLTQP